MNKKLEKSMNNGIWYLLLLVIILGMGLYILYDKGYLFSSSSQNKKTSLKECDSCICDDKCVPCVCDDKNKEVSVDLSKSLNPYDGYFKYEINDYIQNGYGLSVKINEDKQSASLQIDFHKVKQELSSNQEFSDFIETYQITGFDKKIKKVYFGEMAHTSLADVIFYLMEDETVMYTKLFDYHTSCKYNPFICTSDDLKQLDFSPRLIEGVNNVVEIYNAKVFFTTGSSRSPIAVTKDGSFYDL